MQRSTGTRGCEKNGVAMPNILAHQFIDGFKGYRFKHLLNREMVWALSCIEAVEI